MKGGATETILSQNLEHRRREQSEKETERREERKRKRESARKKRNKKKEKEYKNTEVRFCHFPFRLHYGSEQP